MRESMDVLPGFMQPFLTWLTAIPSQKEVDAWDGRLPSPIYHVILTVLKMISGVFFSSVGFFHESMGIPFFLACFFYAIGFVLTTSAFRKFQVVIYHNCAHNMIFQARKLNRLFGTLIAIFCLIKNFDQYQIAHKAHHHSKKLLTTRDDTLNFIIDQLRIRPSDSIAMMWAKLLLSIFSPVYHARQLLNRINGCLLVSGTPTSAIAIFFWSFILFIVVKLSITPYFITVYMLPLIFGYQISVALRLCAEHSWPTVETLNTRGLDFIVLSTKSVFMGEPLVLKGGRLFCTLIVTKWIVKMLTIHLFFRVFVMVGDTPCHDFHHRRPNDKSWTKYSFARARDKISGCVGFPANYIDSWGLLEAISANFHSFYNCKIYYKEFCK